MLTKRFWVVSKRGDTYCSGHATRALAVAKIAQYWKKVFPNDRYYVEELCKENVGI